MVPTSRTGTEDRDIAEIHEVQSRSQNSCMFALLPTVHTLVDCRGDAGVMFPTSTNCLIFARVMI